MRMCIKVLFVASILALTASCQDTLDTSSQQAKEQSIKQMMVGIYPQNQIIFNQALKTIYQVDQQFHTDISITEANSLTDQKLKGKTVEEILHISFVSKKVSLNDRPPRQLNKPSTTRVANNATTSTLVKTNFIAK